MYSDASKGETKGVGAICQNSWMFAQWEDNFIKSCDPSIEFLELYGVMVAVFTWIQRFRNKRIYLFCDNISVVFMINNSTSSCKNCMNLIRLITLEGLIQNVRIYANHVGTKQNVLAESLSRIQLSKLKKLALKSMDANPMDLPEVIWPVSKIWQ